MWSEVNLDKLFRICSSKRVLKSQWQSKGIPFYRGREVTRLSKEGYVDNELFITEDLYKEFSEKYGVPKAGDIVITAIGTIGNSYIVRSEDRFYFKDASVLWLDKTSDVSSEFINYWLKSPLMKDQLDEGNGATVDTLTIKKLQSLKIQLPPLSEQKRIVAILDEAFAGIDSAIANTEKNIANSRELFESYLNTVFTKQSDGWDEKKLSSLIDISHGYAFKGPDFQVSSDSNKPIVLTPGNYSEDGELVFSEKNTKRFIGKEYPDGYMFNEGDLTIVMTDLSSQMKILGKPAFVASSNILHNQRIGRVIFKTVEVIPKFLYFYLRTGLVLSHIKQTSTGTMVRHTAPKRILSLNISFPIDKRAQSEIVVSLEGLASEIKRLELNYQQKIDSLIELKQSLLQKAFSGELTADNDKLMNEAVA